MKKYEKTLGPKSSELITQLTEKGKEVFTLSDAREIYGKGQQETIGLLRDLVQRKILARIKPGIFLILKIGLETTQLSNWPLIARTLVGQNPYYISHYSAMRLHGLTTHPLTKVFISVLKRKKSKRVQNIFYQFIYIKPDKFWGISDIWVNWQEKVKISDIEKTILDGLDRPDLSGGIKEVSHVIAASAKKIDWTRLMEYASRYPKASAIKRLGFILEVLNLNTHLPNIEQIIHNKEDYILLDPNGKKAGKYLKRWRIKINMNIDEIKASNQ